MPLLEWMGTMDDKIKDAPKYWQSIDSQNVSGTDEFPSGFVEELFEVVNAKKSRREFLTVLGFSVAIPALTSCNKIPVTKALGFLNREEGTVPGVANWYASTCGGCEAACGLLVKTREGRPIKVEGNPDSPHSRGGVCAVGQATVLSLYDSARFVQPLAEGKPTTWAEIDGQIPGLLRTASAKGKIVLITGRVSSPSTLAVIARFREKYPNCEHVPFEPFSYSALFESFEKTHGVRAIPEYSLSDVETLVSIGADFLGSWYGPVAFAKAYSVQRDVSKRKGAMLRHVQVEALMSVAGSNADLRVPVAAGEEALVLATLLQEVSKLSGRSIESPAVQMDGRLLATVRTVAADLWKAKGKSLVLSGSNRVDDQMAVNTINELLGNIGRSVKLMPAGEVAVAADGRFENLVSDMVGGKVSALLSVDANPGHAYYSTERWQNGVSKVPLHISLAEAPNETSKSAHYICPGNHFLESWNDHSLGGGKYGLTQPTIQPLRATRMFQESLLRWAGETLDYYDFIRSHWKAQIFARQKRQLLFEGFWSQAVHDGGIDVGGASNAKPVFKNPRLVLDTGKSEGLDLILYQKTGIRDGRHANNPWLHELPDPITKVTWDNYAQLSPETASKNGVKTGDLISVQKGNIKLTLPVLVQPGLGGNTVAIAVGYGRTECGKAGLGVGKNAYPFVAFVGGNYQRIQRGVQITKASGHYELALTQTHHVMEGRDLVREISKAEALGTKTAAHSTEKEHPSMWPEHKPGENRWGMAIDLSKCTGCSACVISCQAENNVPVVGREEVLKRREMHWIRLDRYYSGNESNPSVVHQPILCQHCENAPCETVCPVLATVHSSDGLNQQVYNRCVGTRYCANNCPYKVRRFNWFDYSHDDAWGRMALNPDIVVRSRGVMEKCSFCIQRIQEGRLKAKKEGRKVAEGDFKVACQQSCPSDAIVFGDLADPNSEVSKLLEHQKGYQLLEELNVRPRVSFLPKVRNPL